MLLSTAWVQSAVLGGGFFADDFLWFYRLQILPWHEFVGMAHGGHLLATRNLVYWLSYQLLGLEPSGYFWLALITHLLNVALLFVVVHLIAAADCVVDLGPEGGEKGGTVVATGTPEEVAGAKASRTAPYLKAHLGRKAVLGA